MSKEKIVISERYTYCGSLELSTMVCGYLFKHQYSGYTKKEAKRLFKEEVKKAQSFGDRWIYSSQFRGY